MTYKVRTGSIFLITLSILILRQPKNHQYNETQNWGHLQDHVKASAIHRSAKGDFCENYYYHYY